MSDVRCRYRNSGPGGNDPQECAWPHCGCDPAATRVLEHISECGFEIIRSCLETRLIIARTTLERCRTVLGNMALENENRGPFSLVPRWPISHEPLRGDAKNLLPLLDEVLKEGA